MYPRAVEPRTQPNAVWRNRLVLAALWLVFYGTFTLFTPPLLDDADSVHAEVAREMLLRHDFVTLYANGIRYLEKAPVFYWTMAASMKLFGATTAASRVPLALSMLALALLLESFARRAFASSRAGLLAGLITLSSFGIFIFSRINIPDVMVCALLSAALYCYWRTDNEAEPGRTLCWLFAAACAVDVLTKGLIGIVFPLAIVGLHLWLTRGWRAGWGRVSKLHPWSSLAVFLLIATPWHILAALANPGYGDPGHLGYVSGHWQVPLPTDGNVHGWAWFYFINEQIYRYLDIRVPHDYDTVPLWLFLGLIFVWLMPWSAYLPGAIARAWPRRWRIGVAPSEFQEESSNAAPLASVDRTNILLLIWAALPLLFFTFSTRQEYYVLPSLPPMILLLAAALAESVHPVLGPFVHRTIARGALILGVTGVLASAVCLFFILHTRTPAANTSLASLLQQNPGEYALSFGHFLDLNAQAMGLFRLPLALAAFALGVLLPAAYALRTRAARRSQYWPMAQASVLTTAAAAFVFVLASWLGLKIFSPVLTSYKLAQAIRPQLQPDDLIVLHGEYESGSTLGFYLRRNDLHIVEGRSSNLWYGSFFPDAPRIFESRQQIAAEWQGPQRIFLWQDPSDRDRPPLQLPGPVYVVAESGGKQMLCNRPPKR